MTLSRTSCINTESQLRKMIVKGHDLIYKTLKIDVSRGTHIVLRGGGRATRIFLLFANTFPPSWSIWRCSTCEESSLRTPTFTTMCSTFLLLLLCFQSRILNLGLCLGISLYVYTTKLSSLITLLKRSEDGGQC